MSRRLSASLLAAAVALTPIPLIATAQVNVNVNVGFDYFYDELSPYGQWNYHPRWGDVWRPTRVGSDFRPYYRGYWVNTEYGWTWESQQARRLPEVAISASAATRSRTFATRDHLPPTL